VIDKGVAKPYAHALFGAASAEGAVEAVTADLDAFEAVAGAHPELIRFLESPQETDEVKRALVEKLFRGRTHDLFMRMIFLLMRKKRIPHLLDIVEAYGRIVEESQGIAEARVTTAVPLPKELADRLRVQLERLFKKKVRIIPRVDPRIIGGFFVMIEGKIIDRSVRSDLEALRQELLGVEVPS
jgi:F-type H+-transporting ATPase subunit delta